MNSQFHTFVLSFPKGSREREYFEPATLVMDALELEMDVITAFGCIWAFDMSAIELVDSRIVGQPAASHGGVRDVCELVAIKFASINADPAWWYSAYAATEKRREVHTCAHRILIQIQDLPQVRQVSTALT